MISKVRRQWTHGNITHYLEEAYSPTQVLPGTRHRVSAQNKTAAKTRAAGGDIRRREAEGIGDGYMTVCSLYSGSFSVGTGTAQGLNLCIV